MGVIEEREDRPRNFIIAVRSSLIAPDNTVLQICAEASGAAATNLQQGCTPQSASFGDAGPTATQNALFSAGPCPHVNALGGCSLTQQGSTETIWYYRSGGPDSGITQTSADIEQLCANIGATFVPP